MVICARLLTEVSRKVSELGILALMLPWLLLVRMPDCTSRAAASAMCFLYSESLAVAMKDPPCGCSLRGLWTLGGRVGKGRGHLCIDDGVRIS